MADIIRAEWEKPFSFRQMLNEAIAREPPTEEQRTIALKDLEEMFRDMPQLIENYVMFVYDSGKREEDVLNYKYYVLMEAWLAPGSEYYHLSYRFREKVGQSPYSVTVQVPRYELMGSTLRTLLYKYFSEFGMVTWYKEMGWDQTTTT